AFNDDALRSELDILLQEFHRMPKFVDRERFSRIGMDHAVPLHFEPLGGKVLQLSGMGEVHKNLVVKLTQVIDSLVERDVKSFPAADCVVQSDPDKKRGFADAMPCDDDSDVAGAESAVDRVFEQSQRVSLVEFLGVHSLLLVFGDQAGAIFLDQFSMN